MIIGNAVSIPITVSLYVMFFASSFFVLFRITLLCDILLLLYETLVNLFERQIQFRTGLGRPEGNVDGTICDQRWGQPVTLTLSLATTKTAGPPAGLRAEAPTPCPSLSIPVAAGTLRPGSGVVKLPPYR